MITLRQLRYLDALAREGHFGRAADRCAVTQPALSAQIRDLEAALGCALVERLATGARLTGIGETIVGRARGILADVGDLEDAARAMGGELAGTLRIGVIPSVAPYLLPSLMAALGKAYPGLQLTVRETVTAGLVEALEDGRLDLVVASLPLDRPALAEVDLFCDSFLLARPRHGRYARLPIVSATDIPAEALLLLEDGHCLRDQAMASCGASDARRLGSAGVTSLSTILELVAAGQGITLLPEMFVASQAIDPSRVVLGRLAEPQPSRRIGLAFRRTTPFSELYRAIGGIARRGAPKLPH